MKKMKFLMLIFFVPFNINAQVQLVKENFEERNQSAKLKELIVGTWISEGSNFNYRDVYISDGTMMDYSDNENVEIYIWTILTTTTESGLKSSELILQNHQNAAEEFRYEIDTLTENKMILTFNSGYGLYRNIFFRQN